MSQKPVHEIPPYELDLLWQDFPHATVIEPFQFGDVRDERVAFAGLGLAKILHADREPVLTYYIHSETPVAAALSTIQIEEYVGLAAEGSQGLAVEAIINGTYEEPN